MRYQFCLGACKYSLKCVISFGKMNGCEPDNRFEESAVCACTLVVDGFNEKVEDGRAEGEGSCVFRVGFFRRDVVGKFEELREITGFRRERDWRRGYRVKNLLYGKCLVIVLREGCEDWSEDLFCFLRNEEGCFEILACMQIDESRAGDVNECEGFALEVQRVSICAQEMLQRIKGILDL